MKNAASVVLCLVLCICAAAAQTPAPTQRIRGDVVAIDGFNLQVKSREGEALAIRLAENYTVTAVVKIDASAIKPGIFVGTASMPQPDGTFKSLEVLVLPESMRGSNEGHYPWDLKPGSMMTNATVADVSSAGAAGQRLTLRYKDGEKNIVVPPDVPIVTFEPGDKSMVIPGAHVLLTATRQPDGSMTATRIAVGKNGLVPPM
jgi:hypothetical protein